VYLFVKIRKMHDTLFFWPDYTR